jgi:two-component system response regulator HydG
MRSAPALRASHPSLVLLVDDNSDGVVARRTVLEELGYTVMASSSGVSALELVEKHRFDLIITDYRMPGMDGVALIGALRERGFEKPIILISGFLAHLGLSEKTTGADLLVQKSANEIDNLVRGVKRLLSTPKKPVSSQGRTKACSRKSAR